MIANMMDRVTALTTRAFAAYQSLNAGERGASVVEYVMVVTFIAIVAVFAVALAGQSLNSEYDTIADSVANYGR
jgi:Flp pilus assembly pilin Flp